jgi:hypothetical protein
MLVKLSTFSKFGLFFVMPRLGSIVGSSMAFFSLAPCMLPLSGAFGGVLGSLVSFGLLLALRLLASGFFPLALLVHHIPGLFASLYWAVESKLLRIVPAMLCIALFLAHPVGAHAALYSTLWLVPIYITLKDESTLFSRALASTFTAHAVGSVIWLYTVPMPADMWLVLIPLACIERVAFAGLMGVYYRTFENCLAYFASRQKHIVAPT